MKKLVIQVGAHKTATTYVQRLFFANKPRLFKLGIHHYGMSRETAHLINKCICYQPEKTLDVAVSAYCDELCHEINNDCETVFHSWEGFCGYPFTDGIFYKNASYGALILQKIQARLDCELEIILTVRRQDEFLQSYYIQFVKEGATLDFASYIRNIDFESMDWTNVAQIFKGISSKLVVLPYETIKESHGEFLSTFTGLICPEIELVEKGEIPKNQTYSAQALEIARFANGILETTKRRELRRFLEIFSANQEKPVLLNKLDIEKIRRPMTSCNLLLANKFHFNDEQKNYYQWL